MRFGFGVQTSADWNDPTKVYHWVNSERTPFPNLGAVIGQAAPVPAPMVPPAVPFGPPIGPQNFAKESDLIAAGFSFPLAGPGVVPVPAPSPAPVPAIHGWV
jgi:hypothetical protein